MILYGDGSCGFSLMEFDTFTRHNFSVIALIGNDACWSQIAREQISSFHCSVAVGLEVSQFIISYILLESLCYIFAKVFSYHFCRQKF